MRILLQLVALMALAVSSLAASPEELAREVGAEFMSPYCVGRVIRDCPSSKADALRKEILAMAESGRSKESIVNELVTRYGEEIRAVPAMEGIGILAWIAPIVFILVGVLIVGKTLRSSSKERCSPEAPRDTNQPL